MDVVRSSLAEEHLGIACVDTSADGDVNASVSLTNQAGDCIRTEFSGGLAPGGEEALCTGVDDGFESRAEIGSLVESAVEGDGEGSGELDEAAGAGHINDAVTCKQAEDEAGYASFFGKEEVLFHRGEESRGRKEVSATRADHCVDGEGDVVEGLTQQAGAGSKAS